jgi:hypothetical protein
VRPRRVRDCDRQIPGPLRDHGARARAQIAPTAAGLRRHQPFGHRCDCLPCLRKPNPFVGPGFGKRLATASLGGLSAIFRIRWFHGCSPFDRNYSLAT